jgi:cephalosporin hydroxylase
MSIGTTFHERPMSRADMREIIQAAQSDPCVDAFHRLWFDTPSTWGLTTYRGVPALKNPLDLQIYHEIIMAVRPRLIIETGGAFGGTALMFRDAMEMSGRAPHVITIDRAFQDPKRVVDWRRVEGVRRMEGSSLDSDILTRVGHAVEVCAGPVLVSLDSDHGRAHVLAELHAYAPFVTSGSYCVVEDTDLGGHPVEVGVDDGGPGPAVEAFLVEHPEFTPDLLCERYLLTSNPGGWLKRGPA